MSFRDFFQAYVDAALWSSLDEDGTPLDELGTELTPEALARMAADCADFFNANRETWEAVGLPDAYAGADFWLDRNGHGIGFWDRAIGEAGDKLTDAAHAYGEADLYVTDAGTIAHY